MTYYVSKSAFTHYGYNSVTIWIKDPSRIPTEVRPEMKEGGVVLFSIRENDGKTPDKPSDEYLSVHFIKFE